MTLKQSLSKLAACVLAAFALCSCTPKEIVLKGTVANMGGIPIVYTRTIDGIQIVMKRDTLRLNSDSTFCLTMPADGSEKIGFHLQGYSSLGARYFAPGTYSLHLDWAAEEHITIENDGYAKENEAIKVLDRLNTDVWDLRARRGDAFDIAKDTVASSVWKKLQNYESKLVGTFDGLDETFRKKALCDIRMQLLLAFQNQYLRADFRGSDKTKEEWKAVYGDVLKHFDINRPDNVFSDAFCEAVINAMGIKTYIQQKRKSNSREEALVNCFTWYSDNLTGVAQEAAMAFALMEDDNNERYTENVPVLYEQFKTLYPASVLLPVLDKGVKRNIAFNKGELSDSMHIIPTDSVKTLAEITGRYKGKVVLVDVWSTWCGPCRKSFKQVRKVQEYAEANDIVLLYISIDRPSDVKLWKKMIANFNLKGEHAIINEAYRMDIYKTFGTNGYLRIPHTAIYNKKGELQYPKAAPVEDWEQLVEQLETANRE